MPPALRNRRQRRGRAAAGSSSHVLARHQFAPKRRVGSGLIGIGRKVFSRMAKSGAGPEFADQPIEMLERGLAALRDGRLPRWTAVVERARQGADQPGRADRRASDHHARRAGKSEHGPRVFRCRAIAIDDDRDRDRIDDGANGGPIGATFVELAARAPVDGRHLRARPFGPPREFRRIQGRFVPAQAHLDGYGNRHRLDDRLDETLGIIEIAHERRAGQRSRHAPRRATHVDVDQDGALRRPPYARFPPKRSASQPTTCTAWGANPSPSARTEASASPPEKGLGRDHLGEDKRSPEAARDPPHRQIADPRHRGKQRPPLEPDRSNRDRRRRRLNFGHYSFCLHSSQLHCEGKSVCDAK